MTSFISPQSKLFGHMDRLAAIKRGERPAPVNVEIFLTNRCSHGCIWCAYAHTHTRGPLAGKVIRPSGAMDSGDVMDTDFALDMLRQLAHAGVKSVTFSGGGEPTLHQHFDRIVATANAYGLEVGLYTHGGHISAERAKVLKQYATFVYVSLDECKPDTFKASKGVSRFDAVLQGIRNLVAAKGKATIGVGFLLHRDNFSQVPQMVELGHSLGVNYVQFRPTVLTSQSAPGQIEDDTKWVNWAIGHLRAFESDPLVIADIARFEMYRDWKSHGYATCYGAALGTAISPNGLMWRCTNKTEHPDALLGDLSVDDFATIWALSSGPCAVDSGCRAMCRQHLANIQLQPMMQEMPHANFI